jgi:hypothetical protein
VTSWLPAFLALQAAASAGPDCRPESASGREARAVASGIVDAEKRR